MLIELHIEHLGVIERLDLVLGPGLTALTGETGAGKTMLVEAIELLTGGRADAAMVRHGADEARVDGRFVRPDGVETVLSRVVPAVGRSRAYVDGRLATAASLADIAADMVDLHGQHAHQSLLSSATQRAALDAYGSVDLEPLRAARARLTEIDAALAALGGDERARAREIDLLRHQVAELDAAGVTDPAEDDELDGEESVLADALAHREAGAAAYEALAGDGGARDGVGAALASVDARHPYAEHVRRLHDLLAELDDLAAGLRDTAEAIEESPDRLAQIRERRQVLVDLRRKYGQDLEAVMAFHADAEDRLRELETYEQRAAELDARRAEAVEAERVAAVEVGRARRAAAEPLADAVQGRLRSLAMPHAEVRVEVGEHPDDHPGDRVRFLLAANPGSPLLPLDRVASGGELARSMLALRLVLSGADGPRGGGPRGDGPRGGGSRGGGDDGPEAAPAIGTLVFDEVDAGIGGEAAEAIGRALAELGADHQVLVVTHLAQVAAVATTQVSVTKRVEGDTTFASAAVTSGDDRVVEIARMLSGAATESARAHARELLAERHA